MNTLPWQQAHWAHIHSRVDRVSDSVTRHFRQHENTRYNLRFYRVTAIA